MISNMIKFRMDKCYLPAIWMLFSLYFTSSIVTGKKIFCYYSSFAQTREGPGNFLPEDIDPHLCTHIIYAFVDITPDGRDLTPFNRNDQGPSGLYARTLALKEKNPSLKVLLAVGGWSIGSKPFIPMVRTEENRRVWVENVVSYLREHGFDGFDVDWEFPATRGSPSDDKYKFTALMKELYEAFAQEARESGRDKLILTMATASGTFYINQSYEPKKIIRYIDYMLLMTYNYHGLWEKTTGHHSGLHPHSTDPTEGDSSGLNQEWSIDYWLNVGIPKQKLIVGIPTYAMSFTLADQSQTGVGAPTNGGGRMGRYTKETGILAYYEICENMKEYGWQSEWIGDQAVPYAYGGDQWAGYENVRSVTLKAKNIVDRGLAGAFVWSVEMGDFGGTCGQGPYPLLSAINSVIETDQGSSRSDWQPRPRRIEKIRKAKKVQRPEEETSDATSGIPSPSVPQGPKTSDRRRGKQRRMKTWRKKKTHSLSDTAQYKGPNMADISDTASSSARDDSGDKSSSWYTGAPEKWESEEQVSKRRRKKGSRKNAAAASENLKKLPHNVVWSETDDSEDYSDVPEHKWWPRNSHGAEEEGRANARATARPGGIPAGPARGSPVTVPTTHADEESDAASASAGTSSDYCQEYGVGTFAHPHACDRFIICLPGSWRKYPPHVMSCPVGTRFDTSLKICNYAARVPC